MISPKASARLLIALTVVVVVASSLFPRVPQPLSYHLFADQRSFLRIPNFGDVVSNVPFGLIGIWGLFFLLGSNPSELQKHFIDSRERWPYVFVFIGVLLTAFGSSYYHLSPNNARLVWDRLPMTIAFMAMVAAIISEQINLRAGLWSLPFLLLVGMGSVLQWYASEIKGAGDLRFYAAVQTYSAMVLLLALVFPRPYTRTSDFAIVLGFYALAKAFETFDKPIFGAWQIVSGHTLKHLAAAAAGYWILRMLQKRQRILSAASATGASSQDRIERV